MIKRFNEKGKTSLAFHHCPLELPEKLSMCGTENTMLGYLGCFHCIHCMHVSRSTWPPILQAAAVWLSYGQGFESNETDENDEASRNPDEINSDMFHLLLGVCVEGLANTRSADLTKEQVSSCLKTLLALLG